METSVDAELRLMKECTSRVREDSKRYALLNASMSVEEKRCIAKLRLAMEERRLKLAELHKREPDHPRVASWKSLLEEIICDLETALQLTLLGGSSERAH